MTTSYGYDAASRLTSLGHDLAGSANDVTFGLSYLPSGQIATRMLNNSLYDHAPTTTTTAYASNGLNQTTSAGGATVSWEARGNLTSDGVRTYTYDALNRLRTGGGAGLSYDPLDRLYQMTGAGAARFQYDGAQLATTFDGAGTMLERYVAGPSPDEWAVVYAGSSSAFKTWPLQDWQGSVVALTDGAGAATAINAYDEYGQPRPGNVGRMQYTGQMMLPDFGLQHYKARAYHAGLGRFVQTDPVGYEQGMNLYAYVGNDPVNGIDPDGRECVKIGIRYQCFFNSIVGNPTRQQAAQISAFSDAYTAVVNELMSNQDRVGSAAVPVIGADGNPTGESRNVSVTAGEIGQELIDRNFVADVTDPGNPVAATSNTYGRANTTTVNRHGLAGANYPTPGARQQVRGNVAVHEGVHGSQGERAAFASPGSLSVREDTHQSPYSDIVDELLGRVP